MPTTTIKRRLEHTAYPVMDSPQEVTKINADGKVIIREYGRTVEALSPIRTKGHNRFLELLKKIGAPSNVISSIVMAPDLYSADSVWLEWLFTISSAPYNISLAALFSSSQSIIQGNKVQQKVSIDWESIRGQEELVHRAIRNIYPKSKISDYFPQALLWLFYVLSVPGSFVAFYLHKVFTNTIGVYFPYCVFWTITGCLNLLLSAAYLIWNKHIRVKDAENDPKLFGRLDKAFFPMLFLSIGLIGVAGIYGIISYFWNLNSLEADWLKKEKYKKMNTRRHYAENRTVAFLFERVFDVELPSFTSKWVYPIIYPLLGIIPASIGWAISSSDVLQNHTGDVLTWIGLLGGNVLAFGKVIRIIAKIALFRDPVLERLQEVN